MLSEKGKDEEMREKLIKLPKWAQDYIRKIEREREIATHALNEYVDSQTPSPFFIDEWESTGETIGPTTKIRYIQTHKMSVQHAGVQLDIYLRDKEIDLKWHDGHHTTRFAVTFIPTSFMQASLISVRNIAKEDKE